MGILDRFLSAFRLSDDYDEYDDYEYDDEYDEDDYDDLDDDLTGFDDDDFDDEEESYSSKRRREKQRGKGSLFGRLSFPDDDDFDRYDPDEEEQDWEYEAEAKSTSSKKKQPAAKNQPPRKKRGSEKTETRVKEESHRREPPVRRTRTKSKVTSIRRKNSIDFGNEVNVIHPRSMEDTPEIADWMGSNCTVVLNLEGLDISVSQRIIDFSCGVCYSLNGSLQKISNYIFILTPAGVDISGDFQSILSGEAGMPAARSGF